MTVSIVITVDDEEVQQALNRLIAAGRDMKPAMEQIGGHLEFTVRRRFELMRDPEGRPWAPHAKSTVRRRGIGAHILTLRGRLRDSISWRATSDAVAVGTNVPYAAAHQFGATITHAARQKVVSLKKFRGKKSAVRFVREGTKGAESRTVTIGAHTVRIPARPFLGFDDYDRTRIREIIRDHLQEAIG